MKRVVLGPWGRRFVWTVGGVLALWALAWLAVPPLLKWQLQTRASDALGRTVTVGAVHFAPWSLQLTLDELVVGGAPGAAAAEPLLQVGRLYLDVDVQSLWRLAPVLAGLEVDAPRLCLARIGTGHYDIDDLLVRFAPSADSTPAEPARFALHNVQVRDAQVRFDDRPAARVHVLEKGVLNLPFVSNLPSQVQAKVEPRLAFTLNGSAFDSGAQATPFAPERQGTFTLAFDGIDVAPYLPYLPEALPVRLQQGRLGAKLTLRFDQPPGAASTVALQGMLSAHDVAASDRDGAPLVAWKLFGLEVRDLQPLQRRATFGTLRLDGLQLHVRRDAKGDLNLMQLVGTAPAAAPVARPAEPASAWQLSLAALQLDAATLLWNDAAVAPAVAWRLGELGLSAKDLHWPSAQPVPFKASASLWPQADSAAALARITLDGTAAADRALVAWKLDALRLDGLAPYLAPLFVARMEGTLGAAGRLDWSAAADAPRLSLSVEAATLEAVRVGGNGTRGSREGLALEQAVFGHGDVDLLAHHVALGRLALRQPSLSLARDGGGQWNVERWFAGSAKAHAAPKSAQALPSSPWRVTLGDVSVDGGALHLADARPAQRVLERPLQFAVAGLQVRMNDFAWPGERDGLPTRLQAALRIGVEDGARTPAAAGSVSWTGRIGLHPLQARGALRADRFPLHAFEPYLGDALPVSVLRVEASAKGDLTVRDAAGGWIVDVKADTRLTDVHVSARTVSDTDVVTASDELLGWQSLALQRLRFTMKPSERSRLEIGEATLSDFFARLVVTEQGRFNLSDVAAAPPASAASSPEPVAPVAAASAAAPASAPMSLDLDVGTTQLVNGRIDFSDHFVRPNYSADLTELNGRLGQFRSGSREMAALELRGRAAGTALLEINGSLNPTADPLALDIHARATDLELAPLSPYAGKYAGYAIERGKLSMDVTYKIDANGKLDAKNQLVLNQLTFGDKVDSPDATKLPVLLAVALLKDRNGVIDINLPVSGSINDPKFSVGGIIVKVIVNLLVKALTAPFSLLASGGTHDLSLVEFQPGKALATEAGRSALDKVAKALTERPALKMTVTGAADPASEREAYLSTVLESRLLAERRRELMRAGEPADAPVALSADDRTRLLRDLYRASDIPSRPRNAIGLLREIAAPEMEALMKSRILVTADAMRELALQRGLAVRDALIAHGLPSDRLFVAAPKLRASGDDDAAWTPRVQLSLAVH